MTAEERIGNIEELIHRQAEYLRGVKFKVSVNTLTDELSVWFDRLTHEQLARLRARFRNYGLEHIRFVIEQPPGKTSDPAAEESVTQAPPRLKRKRKRNRKRGPKHPEK